MEQVTFGFNQMFDRDWQPSTLMQAPVISDARCEARNATIAATSSG